MSERGKAEEAVVGVSVGGINHVVPLIPKFLPNNSVEHLIDQQAQWNQTAMFSMSVWSMTAWQ